jgi:hypothetical protein
MGDLPQPAPLGDVTVWIVDDGIPIQEADFEKDDMLSGARPIDRTALRSLLPRESWQGTPLMALCRQLIDQAQDVRAFLQPAAARAHLDSGAPVPDIVVFDLVYGAQSSKANALQHLESILAAHACCVQVYTDKSAEEATGDIADLAGRYPSRLSPPLNKAETDAAHLALVIADRLKTSLSSRLAKGIRYQASAAIEKVLVSIDNLPLKEALKVLAGEPEAPGEEDLLELISTKVGEALLDRGDLTKTIADFANERGLSHGDSAAFAGDIVAVLTSHIREGLRGGGSLIAELRGAWAEAANAKEVEAAPGRAEEVARRFVSFRLYASPNDTLVRTGDIVEVPSLIDPRGAKSDLFLVITPACDIEHFWRRTRGILTLARLEAVDPSHLDPPFRFDFKPPSDVSSITARKPIILPTVATSQGTTQDYALFFHQIAALRLDRAKPADNGKVLQAANGPLTYAELDKAVTRVCRLSEPFLSGVLSKIEAELFRVGVPDFPMAERDRLKKVLKGGGDDT